MFSKARQFLEDSTTRVTDMIEKTVSRDQYGGRGDIGIRHDPPPINRVARGFSKAVG